MAPIEPSICDRLRDQYPLFLYEDASFHEDSSGAVTCSFRFRANELTFEPTCRFTFTGKRHDVAPEVMANLVFHLGLAEMPSYWKATCSPRIEVRAGALSAEQIAFWQWLLTEGMGEFHYHNQTRFTDPDFVTITASGALRYARFDDPLDPGHVVPVGGGKDSLVTLDLLGQRTEAITALAINPPPSTGAAMDIVGIADRAVIDRRIDPRLLDVNKAGYLNGHTPFGAVVALASALAAVTLRRDQIVLSNESSSDHSTLVYRGKIINHQLGKSSSLEAAMHRYIASWVAADLRYFSVLRPFNELQIAGRFAALTELHGVVRSCNRGRKTDAWCGACPKCLSTFIVLAPFLERSALVRIIGKDLLLDPACQAMLPSLLGEGAERPFECVATPAEIRAALELCGDTRQRVSPSTLEALTRTGERGLVPEALYSIARAALQPRVSPLVERAAVGVVGLGLEGTSTCGHLVSSADRLDLTVIDDDPSTASRLPAKERPSQHIRFASGEEAVKLAPQLGVVFKSPGVPPSHPAIAALSGSAIVTSNTSLFFERCKGTIVGVTGTKGKSTTTSLLAHVLREAGFDARLVGNIGKPCLDDLDDLAGGDTRTIHCVELSSFQLEGLATSPHFAVVLGIFGDHLDRYGSMEAYVEAKASIARYQRRSDVVLYNADCPRATAIAGLSPARRVAFGRERPALLGDGRERPLPLLGAFNHYNIWPSILVGRAFGVGDADLAAAIRSFRPLPMRLETVVEKDDIRFVCDIRSTAPEVTAAALEALGESVGFLLLGGVDRNQDYRTLLPALERSAVRHVILFPPTGARIRETLEGSSLAHRFSFFEPASMEEAIRYVYAEAPKGPDVCLMSTAAPSNGGLFAGPDDKAKQFAYWAAHLGRRAEAAS